MTLKDLFNTVSEVYVTNKDKITDRDILAAFTEELGEYSRAVRVEEKAVICSHKIIEESSKVEVIDIILVCFEAFIHRGGTYPEMIDIINTKLHKWISAWEKENGR
jgi:hypothetical protein